MESKFSINMRPKVLCPMSKHKKLELNKQEKVSKHGWSLCDIGRGPNPTQPTVRISHTNPVSDSVIWLIPSVLINVPSPFGLSSSRRPPPPTSSHLLFSTSGAYSNPWFVIVGTVCGGRYAVAILLWVLALTFGLNFAAACRANSTLHKFVGWFNLWSHIYR